MRFMPRYVIPGAFGIVIIKGIRAVGRAPDSGRQKLSESNQLPTACVERISVKRIPPIQTRSGPVKGPRNSVTLIIHRIQINFDHPGASMSTARLRPVGVYFGALKITVPN